jgi:cytochrome c oxidase assembly factor CtaG
MNQSPLPKILMGVLALVSALCVFYSIAALRNGRELRQFQTKLAVINQRMPVISALGADLLEYSKKNPALDPILETYGFKPGKGSAPAPAPAIKPPTK